MPPAIVKPLPPVIAPEKMSFALAGFAWEFLQRNPDYRENYKGMSRDASSGTTVALEAALAQRWGG